MPIDEEKVRDEAIKVACMYLLYDKENETSLRMAFVALVQERHNHFHTEREKNADSDIDFQNCENDICKRAVLILQESREPAIEFTPLSLELIENYKMQVRRTGNTCRVELIKKGAVEPVTLQAESIKLKV